MAVVHRPGERKGDPGAHADPRGLLDSELGRDPVGGAEADAADVAGQTVWVFRDRLNPIGAIDFADAHRALSTPFLYGNSRISRITFGSAQPAMIRSARFGPTPAGQAPAQYLKHGFAKGSDWLYRLGTGAAIAVIRGKICPPAKN
jgi:hypothetical protein